jgi:uncharacterized protein
MKTFVAFLLFVVALAIAPSALAYTPPTMTAHVTDTAHKLTEPERIAIDRKLEDYRLKTTSEIAVFLPATLDGDTIEDVANATARAWDLGAKGKKNGVLLVIAPVERRARIEVAVGNQGALTDLQANDIIRGKIRPRLTPGSENYRAAVDDATDAIIVALDKDAAGTSPIPSSSKSHPASGGDVLFGLVFLLFMLLVPIILMVVVIRAIARAFSSNGPSAGAGWASGSSWSSSSNDSSWGSSGGSSDWGGSSGGGGGDSGFSGGGGGGFDGGGSSDSF